MLALTLKCKVYPKKQQHFLYSVSTLYLSVITFIFCIQSIFCCHFFIFHNSLHNFMTLFQTGMHNFYKIQEDFHLVRPCFELTIWCCEGYNKDFILAGLVMAQAQVVSTSACFAEHGYAPCKSESQWLLWWKNVVTHNMQNVFSELSRTLSVFTSKVKQELIIQSQTSQKLTLLM